MLYVDNSYYVSMVDGWSPVKVYPSAVLWKGTFYIRDKSGGRQERRERHALTKQKTS